MPRIEAWRCARARAFPLAPPRRIAGDDERAADRAPPDHSASVAAATTSVVAGFSQQPPQLASNFLREGAENPRRSALADRTGATRASSGKTAATSGRELTEDGRDRPQLRPGPDRDRRDRGGDATDKRQLGHRVTASHGVQDATAATDALRRRRGTPTARSAGELRSERTRFDLPGPPEATDVRAVGTTGARGRRGGRTGAGRNRGDGAQPHGGAGHRRRGLRASSGASGRGSTVPRTGAALHASSLVAAPGGGRTPPRRARRAESDGNGADRARSPPLPRKAPSPLWCGADGGKAETA